jgi:RimJ/RimL family protein N-acetyltransferase
MVLFSEKIKHIKKAGAVDIFKSSFDGKPVSLRMIDDSEETVNLLLEWRNEHWDGFNTKFKGTFERTKKWLIEEVLHNPKRILFLIIFNGEKIGHMGLTYGDERDDFIWFENFMRGKKTAPGLMAFIEKEYIKWIFDEFDILKIKLIVFSDNYKTIRLHEKNGFLTQGIIPLKRKFTTDGWIWEETKLSSPEEYAERYFLIMEISKKKIIHFLEID